MKKIKHAHQFFGKLFIFGYILLILTSCSQKTDDNNVSSESWTFVSMPDFLNIDTVYPQPGWEETLDFVLTSVKSENPDFLLVAGDLLMGRWREAKLLEKYAPVYYPAQIERMEAHGLKYYTAIGDHELGDNPWPLERGKLVPRFKEMFRNYMQMPLNGPDHMKRTAFYFDE